MEKDENTRKRSGTDTDKRKEAEQMPMKQQESKQPAEPKHAPTTYLLWAIWLIYVAALFIQNRPANQPEESSAQQPAAYNVTEEPKETLPAAPESPQPAPAALRDMYLTFDDGPCSNTPEILDILDRYEAKATFFTVGYYVNEHPEYSAEIVRRGNLIACHSYTHDMEHCYASADAFMDEEKLWEQAVQRACGSLPERICVRFPGGSTTSHAASVRDAIIERLTQNHMCWFDWNAGDNDKWKKGNTDGLPDEEYYMQSYRDCMKWFDKKPDEPIIFLLHETEIGTVHVLPEILADMKARGCVFKLLDSHPEWNALPPAEPAVS